MHEFVHRKTIISCIFRPQYDPEHSACKAGHRVLRKIVKLNEKANVAFNGQKWEDAVKHLSDLNLVDRELTVMRMPVLVKVLIHIPSCSSY